MFVNDFPEFYPGTGWKSFSSKLGILCHLKVIKCRIWIFLQ